ncbi:TIGR02270 family protein [Pseudoduganella sp. OTU4001]|uniref:TIGR02270 family protein n=1 Tax=Pseudoduganella sp. OTU4001 TaxID=3043854 RepID=UPI00313E19B5
MSMSPVLSVIRRHVEEAAILRNARNGMVSGPHVRLRHLQRLDERLAAHLDGVAVAGPKGAAMCWAALERLGIGEVFTAAVRAIEDRDVAWLERIMAIVEAEQSLLPALRSAFGWVSAQFLQGTIRDLLESPSPFRQQLGISACAMHRVDPGPMLPRMLESHDASVRAASLRAAGECGRIDLLNACTAALADDDLRCRYFAARSAVFLGDRGRGVATLEQVSSEFEALSVLLKLLDVAHANSALKTLAQSSSDARTLVRGAGVSGDPYYVPWLIRQMGDVKLARLAGEAFSLLAGVDLAALGLDASGAGAGEDDMAVDDDDGLPWPDQAKVQAWWDANQHRFQPGVRYFMGEPPSVAHCLKVLREGYQRQRIAAAEYLCLLQPGTKLFPTSAPAWRQQRWLKQMES